MNKALLHFFKQFPAGERIVWLDTTLLLAAFAVTWFMIGQYDGAQWLLQLLHDEQWAPVGNVILSLALMSLYLGLYVLRRQREMRNKITEANTDALVSAFNRRKGQELLDTEVVRANLHKVPLSLIMFDIDHFKRINDTHGHGVGDNVLKRVMEIVHRHSRRSDILIRWGGEEFLIGCCGTELAAATKLAERIRQAISQFDFELPEGISASFGCTAYRECEDLDTTLDRVDGLLYRSKQGGRNRVFSE
ncbi:GGDEF domain-containing protein [Aestuariibacter halophilus]|uniref:diguanylate cyclase n=1 Tax=Fluctibacter halophilus TaxID=226011 RepID=A0ABS8G6S9_9ALTE|nr:GGDEF domain-containing protein [Aestuariibacter halophilus]MCC2616297.1 GGDEF domain-containing protein [Aestuariibacter halophilus]